MTEDVGTTKRKPLTPTQRLKLFELFKGKCVLCGLKIMDGSWIDEHLRALGLGGTNDFDNRGPAHKKCADLKTHGKDGDLARIAKAKNQKKAALGIKRAGHKPMPGGKASKWKRTIDGRVVPR